MPEPSFHRPTMLRRLHDEVFDVLVIGGGITGAGVALDAASRGLRTALVERDDFASGTSSKSSKLVHGGLRYLQQGDVRLVYEALHERQRLRRNAPHLVSVLPFMIPILTKDGLLPRRIARVLGTSLWMYDLTGGWRIGRRHRRLRAEAALAHLPTMPAGRLASAYLYFDAAAEDARLTLAVARTAADHGAVVANRCAVVELTRDASGALDGAIVDADGARFPVRARAVVNATGVWADTVRTLDEGRDPGALRPAKGVHLTVAWEKVRNDIAVVVPVPKDRRSLFVVPWGPRPDGTFTHAYVGTTDTDFDGSLDDPQCTLDDVDYVLTALNASVTTGITADDVTGVWAGLRPLVRTADPDASPTARTADLSRRHQVTTSDSGLVTVTGGKLTTYREMAEDTVDEVADRLGLRARCRTRRLRLHGADGSDAAAVRALVARDPSLGEPIVPGLPYLRAEVVHAARTEMATTVDDVLTRRTRARLIDRAGAMAAADDVARLLAGELDWDDATAAAEAAAFRDDCAREAAATLAPGAALATGGGTP